ncbi:peptidyl-prolyl cis-trans isomerase D [Hydrogenivirga caldilitoris]|uniref:Periplasmic chaperone PpiD n=1 Tax=Hydrogenivirga caldilitoris TaxID=246264 RepID=A0A497XRI4_9AQUI|nr:peptidylprolyl isomerase [Hydrogenivirga caldilitoris]RLJ71548.1 peptidyl-prolyl cis-trans isomerase D [Hydrogenivirga caldilitoris]
MYGLIQKHKQLAAIIIAVASISFLFWMFSFSDIRQMFGLQRCAATVNGYCITLREFSHELRRYQNFLEKEELRSLVKRQVLYNLVNRELLYQKAVSMGIVASNREVIDTIKQDKSFQENGRFSLSLYRETLERVGITPEEYETTIKKSLTVRKLFKLMEAGIYLSDRELEFQKKIVTARFSGRVYLVSPSSVSLSYKPSLEEMKEFYSKNADRFTAPPTKRYRIWETNNKEEAHSIYRDIKRGKIPEGGRTVSEGELPPSVDKQAKTLTINDPVTLSKSNGKYLVVYLEKLSPRSIRSFEEAKEDIEKLLIEQKKAELVRKIANEIKQKLLKGENVEYRYVKFEDSSVEEFITLFKVRGDEVLKIVFSGEKVFGPYNAAGGLAVVYLERRHFHTGDLKDARDMEDTLLRAKFESLSSMFLQRLAEKASIQINEEHLK